MIAVAGDDVSGIGVANDDAEIPLAGAFMEGLAMLGL